ncbi:gamma-glutamyltransferase family protein [Aliiglaciecola lipolytica]|uniref:Gamma-glutamyltranspeptidase n=1 Tax=Aliiglaciecola lipolytica E3 TaxID=1127673 RepID=K6YDN5_9ALTE|nr:gamma-glutamyltransferase [Aliiglaciecola lipolytica]GAC14758.1 gamma-glutamyltranspeptidase [Aliiglaciecola lipolytica E3]
MKHKVQSLEHHSTTTGFTAPHYAAAQAGQHILDTGGTAIEAMVAAAASIAVVYPHMNGLGGDGFWLISEPGKDPIAIDASGSAAKLATSDFYQGLTDIPSRGGKAALTMAGAVSGWQKALEVSQQWQPNKSLQELLSTAIGQAEWGLEVTQSLTDASFKTFDELHNNSGFEQFLIKGKALKKGKIVKLPKLAATLTKLAENGLDDFYRGEIGNDLAADLAQAGSPIRSNDFIDYQAKFVDPLQVDISVGKLYNLGAPTQGVASLLILALFDKVKHLAVNEHDFVHLLVECTKQAFILRNQYVTDESRLTKSLDSLLNESEIDKLLSNIDINKAMQWPHAAKSGDTVWMGACDSSGRMVSYIQSLYWEFGSGVVSNSTGIVWNNRGTSFSLDPQSNQFLKPGLKPFHTLNPAFAELHDGRRISYGTMGGEGQPQTQAAIFSRHVFQNLSLEHAIEEPRWLLGRTWGDQSHNLKIEEDIDPSIVDSLQSKGHDVAIVAPNNEMMGHAGMIVRSPSGKVTAATDPRSDGKAFPY